MILVGNNVTHYSIPAHPTRSQAASALFIAIDACCTACPSVGRIRRTNTIRTRIRQIRTRIRERTPRWKIVVASPMLIAPSGFVPSFPCARSSTEQWRREFELSPAVAIPLWNECERRLRLYTVPCRIQCAFGSTTGNKVC